MSENQSIKDRIEIFLEVAQIRKATFEKACGFSNGYIRNLKENPSAQKIEQILSNYPEINRVWLLTGEGEMLKQGPTQIVSGQSAHHFTQTGDVEAAPDGDRFITTINRMLDEIAAQRIMYQQLLDRQISISEKLIDDSKRSCDD